MSEFFRKLLLYFQPSNSYWQNTNSGDQKYFLESKLGFYPLQIIPRIEQGHYQYFDEEGIPCFPNKNGIMVHHFTTMASYALGQWEYWLVNGKEEHKKKVLKIADFMANAAIQNDDETYLLLDYYDEKEKAGDPCAMNQGEAISVFARAYEITGDKSYLDIAFKCINAFKKKYGEGGICASEKNTGLIWYLEGGKFILNGHNYALFGIHDLYKVTQSPDVLSLFQKGYDSVIQLLKEFDNKYWSWYWLDEKKYIASIMYHNLHICQLKALHDIQPNDEVQKYINIFQQYMDSPFSRFKAGKDLFTSKI